MFLNDKYITEKIKIVFDTQSEKDLKKVIKKIYEDGFKDGIDSFNLGDKYLSTNMQDDSVLKDEEVYRAVINNVRNGNFDLVNMKTGNVVLEFQNNEV